MLRKVVLFAFVAAVALLGSCTKTTKLVGTLLLQPGQTGDVQNTKVALYEKADLTGDPVMTVASKTGVLDSSDFEFKNVVEGYYYLVAWKDLNGDGVISDKDIVGVHGGTYTPGHGGTQVTVLKGQTTDVGKIEMLIYKELKITATGQRLNGGLQTKFSYSFNYDVALTKLTITFPSLGSIDDVPAPGAKTAGTSYDSDTYFLQGGGVMPTGTHSLEFVGTWNGAAFDVIVTVDVS
ncbi:MAG TPA: hypothetical protein VMH22_03380 [bacterium]|nr:hypothetical protein [bacterium]